MTPVFTVTDASSSTISSISYQNVNAGTIGNVVPLLFWNNMGGTSVVPDAVQVTITTMTFTGQATGDTVANGQEVVTDKVLEVQCTSQDPTNPFPSFTPIGGTTTAPIGDGSEGVGTISGAIGGTFAYVNTHINAPSGISAGPAAFMIRCSFLYS